MPVNHLEQIIAEWLEYQGYFVRRNLKVGRRRNGGYDCELDVVGFHPGLTVQSQEGVVHVKVDRVAPLRERLPVQASHDCH